MIQIRNLGLLLYYYLIYRHLHFAICSITFVGKKLIYLRSNQGSHIAFSCHIFFFFFFFFSMEKFLNLSLSILPIIVFKRVGKLSCRMFLYLEFSDISSWLDLGYTILARTYAHTRCRCLSPCIRAGGTYHFFLILGNIKSDHMIKAISSRFTHLKLLRYFKAMA